MIARAYILQNSSSKSKIMANATHSSDKVFSKSIQPQRHWTCPKLVRHDERTSSEEYKGENLGTIQFPWFSMIIYRSRDV
jgi:hypothetical protein